MNKELIFLRTFAAVIGVGMLTFVSVAFKQAGNVKFDEIDVQRINIVEPDGTVKMVITNINKFPQGNDSINNRGTNVDRKKRAGMLFFNEDGIECGGFIYDGQKTAKGHSAGLSLTYDQYDGDQVMQLLTQDYQSGGERRVTSSLVFNDRPAKESQEKTHLIYKELDSLRTTNETLYKKKNQEYEEAGLIGGVPRVLLGQTRSKNNGLYLFDDKGQPRGCFYVDKENNARLDFFDEKGNVISSFPEKK